jgi:hypothetical protein
MRWYIGTCVAPFCNLTHNDLQNQPSVPSSLCRLPRLDGRRNLHNAGGSSTRSPKRRTHRDLAAINFTCSLNLWPPPRALHTTPPAPVDGRHAGIAARDPGQEEEKDVGGTWGFPRKRSETRILRISTVASRPTSSHWSPFRR